ncbi:MAG TPA: heme-binding protein [Thermoanaerobaculia bacterium]|nr:heme-binding protein [Thermoanaerobaculia bacterium]
MRRLVLATLLVANALHAGSRVRAVRPSPPMIAINAEPADCAMTPPAPVSCSEGGAAFNSISDAEVDAIVRAAAKSLDANAMTIAVVDRAGRPLALYRKPGATAANDELAVGTARTAAFFSHNQAPLSSRTVRYLSGIHFPPDITNTPSAALYGIENTNRGCDFNVTFLTGQCIPRARSLAGLPCQPGNTAGCGTGIVTNNPGGVPLYRAGQLLGGIGVVGVDGDPQRAEYAAASGAFGAPGIVPVPVYPLPPPGNVFVDGIRLPFLGPDIRLKFASNGAPNGVRLDGVNAGSDNGAFAIAPRNGGCAANGDLIASHAGAKLSMAEVDAIVRRAIATARKTRANIRLPLNRYARMVIAVADVDGSILALHRMPDATVFSVDVAVAKSRNVIWFSNAGLPGVPPGTAVSNRTIGLGGQPFFPPGIDSSVLNPREGPWYRSLYVKDLANACTQGDQLSNPNQNGVVFFAGSTPLYRGHELVGGLGVSGDGIEQDDYVTYFGAGEFLPSQDLWADRIVLDGARLPMFKFPRQPEGVDE